MYVVMCNDHVEAVAFTEESAYAAKRQLREKQETKCPNPNEYVLHWHIKTAPLCLNFGVSTPKIPIANEELQTFRREVSGKFKTAVEGDPIQDYATGIQKLSVGLAHASESIPNGQVLRTRSAVQNMIEGLHVLIKWLDSRGVFKKGENRGDQG